MHKSLIALVGAAGITIAATVAPAPANADCVGCAVGAGILGGVAAGAIIGGAIANSPPPGYYPPPAYYRSPPPRLMPMEGDSAGNCAKRAFTRKNWAKKAWAIAKDTGNFADSKPHPPLRAWRSRTFLLIPAASRRLGSPKRRTPASS